MKQVTKCGGCEKVIRVLGSYTAELKYKEKVFDPSLGVKVEVEKKEVIKLCKPCYIEAGYKPRGTINALSSK